LSYGLNAYSKVAICRTSTGEYIDACHRFAGVLFGGNANNADGNDSSISGGQENDAEHSKSWIGGGFKNVTEDEFASIFGGKENATSEEFGAIP